MWAPEREIVYILFLSKNMYLLCHTRKGIQYVFTADVDNYGHVNDSVGLKKLNFYSIYK